MPDLPSRAPQAARQFIDTELEEARASGDPWPALERAHIVSQPWAWQHTRVHAAMLRLAWRHRDRHELIAQLIRIAVAGPGSLVGRNPTGNTGRSTMRLTEQAPIPPDLAALIQSR